MGPENGHLKKTKPTPLLAQTDAGFFVFYMCNPRGRSTSGNVSWGRNLRPGTEK
jgi:hypothetical protein